MNHGKVRISLVNVILALAIAVLGVRFVYAASDKEEQIGPSAGSMVVYGSDGTEIKRIRTNSRGDIVIGEDSSSWSTIRTNVVANDTTTTYGTGDAGNMPVEGYKRVRFRIFMNSTTNSCSFQCGTATPTTNPYYGFTAKTTITGYSTTSPFIADCDTNGQTVMFPKITDLSSGGNVTSIKAQAYN